MRANVVEDSIAVTCSSRSAVLRRWIHDFTVPQRVEVSPPEPEPRPLHLLFLSHYFPPEGNAPASRVFEMCKRWVQDGHHVTVITCAPNAPSGMLYPGYRNRLWQREDIEGIHVLRVWTFLAANRGKRRRGLNFASFLLSGGLAALFAARPDLLIATSPQFLCGVAGMIVSRVRKLPFILEIRDIWPESITAVGAVRGSLLIRVLERLEQWMYRAANHIVTVGDGYRAQLRLRGVPDEKMSVITNGVDREVFGETKPDLEFRRSHGLEGKFVCGYVGTVGLACGLHVAIDAAKILRQMGRDDIRIAIVGDGAVREELEEAARKAGLTNIVITGRVDKARVPGVLATLDACLVHLKRQPLFETVLPSKMFEAAGMGKPIILGVKGSAAEFLREANAGIAIEPENAEHLVQAILRLAEDPVAARRFGDSGRQHVLRFFDRDRLSRDYLRVLYRTLARCPVRVRA